MFLTKHVKIMWNRENKKTDKFIMLVRRIWQGWHYFTNDDYCKRNLISHPIYIPSISNHWSMVALCVILRPKPSPMTRISWLRPRTLHCHIHYQAHPDNHTRIFW